MTDAEMVDLVESHGGRPAVGWWDRVRQYSLGWVTARTEDGFLVGFANVAWDGGDHAFLLDPKTRGTRQHEGIGTAVVALAVKHARAAGCEWLHVDFDPELAPFYLGACGFVRTDAGLIHRPSRSDRTTSTFGREASPTISCGVVPRPAYGDTRAARPLRAFWGEADTRPAGANRRFGTTSTTGDALCSRELPALPTGSQGARGRRVGAGFGTPGLR